MLTMVPTILMVLSMVRSARCKAMNIPCSENFSLASILGDPVQMKRWTADGLPNDLLSLENALIIHKSRRWPLMIDPQGQANRWIRTSETKDGRKLVSDKLLIPIYIRLFLVCV
jgi:dynein heavy chain